MNPAENNPIFDTTQLNKAFSNNMGNPNMVEKSKSGFTSAIKDPLNHHQNNEGFNQPSKQMNNQPQMNMNQGMNQMQGQAMGGTFGLGGNYGNPLYNNLVYGNAALSNYLSTVKNNNNGLYDGMINPSMNDQLMHKNNIDRANQNDQHQKMLEMMNRQPLQNDDQQSILCLVQQVSLYKELLAQISYQNQLLTRDINNKQQGNMPHHYGGGNNMSYMNLPGMEMSNNNNGMNSLGNMNMNNLNTLNNLASITNNMANMNLQSLNPNMLNSNFSIYQDNMMNNQINMPNMMMNQQQNRMENPMK